MSHSRGIASYIYIYIYVLNIEWLGHEMSVLLEKLLSLPNLIRANITKSHSSLTFLSTLLCKKEAWVLRAEVVRIL